ncbi:tRNA (adenosine(37)-N6)-dimethylallyltransferase MiaA [bacterium]|nr:tRNA (adenosine(37)-N6)-dimethylallyltransferase MiaA [bacterium]
MLEPARIIAVVGPTASGKTETGLTLAHRIGGEIISVDSMQIYRWMDIGTAKPSAEMRAEIPHHLIDICNPDELYNAGQFSLDADRVITQLQERSKIPILLGGTNLYIKSLIHGIIPVPVISTDIKRNIQTLLAEKGLAHCYQQLQALDPKSAAKLHPNDVSRVSRALAVVMETGRSIQEFQEQHRFSQERYKVLFIGTCWPRDILYQRINQRVLAMVAAGLVDEAESLLWRGYSSELPSMKSIGYKQAFSFLDDKISHSEMVAGIQQKSRHYAKKQLTWYRNDPEVRWLNGNTIDDATYAAVWRFLNGE